MTLKPASIRQSRTPRRNWYRSLISASLGCRGAGAGPTRSSQAMRAASISGCRSGDSDPTENPSPVSLSATSQPASRRQSTMATMYVSRSNDACGVANGLGRDSAEVVGLVVVAEGFPPDRVGSGVSTPQAVLTSMRRPATAITRRLGTRATRRWCIPGKYVRSTNSPITTRRQWRRKDGASCAVALARVLGLGERSSPEVAARCHVLSGMDTVQHEQRATVSLMLTGAQLAEHPTRRQAFR